MKLDIILNMYIIYFSNIIYIKPRRGIYKTMNPKDLKEDILQACEEIKSTIDAIITDNDYVSSLQISIRLDYDSRPEIFINKNYLMDIPKIDRTNKISMTF